MVTSEYSFYCETLCNSMFLNIENEILIQLVGVYHFSMKFRYKQNPKSIWVLMLSVRVNIVRKERT